MRKNIAILGVTAFISLAIFLMYMMAVTPQGEYGDEDRAFAYGVAAIVSMCISGLIIRCGGLNQGCN